MNFVGKIQRNSLVHAVIWLGQRIEFIWSSGGYDEEANEPRYTNDIYNDINDMANRWHHLSWSRHSWLCKRYLKQQRRNIRGPAFFFPWRSSFIVVVIIMIAIIFIVVFITWSSCIEMTWAARNWWTRNQNEMLCWMLSQRFRRQNICCCHRGKWCYLSLVC